MKRGRVSRDGCREIWHVLIAALLIATVVGVGAQARWHLMPPPKLSEPAAKSTARRTDFDIGRPLTRPNRRCSRPIPTIEGGANPNPAQPLRFPNAALEPVTWSALAGWQDDDHASAFATFRASCRSMVHSASGNDARPIRDALRTVCARALKVDRFDQEFGATFLRNQLRSDSYSQAWRCCGLSDRVLRTNRRWLARSYAGIYRSDLPAATRPASGGRIAAGRPVSQSRSRVPPNANRGIGAILRSRGD